MRSKLTKYDIINICKRYVYDNISMEKLATDYNCSASHISKSIHKAIVLGFVDLKMANLLKEKAAQNMDKKMRELRISQII